METNKDARGCALYAIQQSLTIGTSREFSAALMKLSKADALQGGSPFFHSNNQRVIALNRYYHQTPVNQLAPHQIIANRSTVSE